MSKKNEEDFPHADLTYRIIGAAMEVHRELGPGFLEAVYGEAFARELALQGVSYVEEPQLPICYKGAELKRKYRVDFLVEDTVLTEIKSVSAFDPIHEAKTIHYLKAGKKYPVALLINFGSISLEWRRFVLTRGKIVKTSA
ncbi:MAG: GxxExxY protein [Planctomycetota bacterium]|jgi:GxxExxY protein